MFFFSFNLTHFVENCQSYKFIYTYYHADSDARIIVNIIKKLKKKLSKNRPISDQVSSFSAMKNFYLK